MNLRDFMRLNLTEGQLRMVQTRCPALMAEIDQRRFTDNDFVVRVIQKNEEALWILWLCLHSSFFVRIIRMRSKHECNSPCNLADFQELPCRWSERLLDELFQSLTSGKGVLENFLGNDELDISLMEYIGIHLHEKFHVEMLRRNGFLPLEESALPAELRRLFARDDRFKTIFVNRWLWGLTEIPVLKDAVVPELPDETLLRWVNDVDEAILNQNETNALVGQLQTASRLRQKSGIPLRTLLPQR